MLLFQRLLYNFRLLLLQIVILLYIVIKYIRRNLFFISQITYSFIAFGNNILVQTFFQLICTICFITPIHKILFVFIHIFLDKTIYEFSLATHSCILNHRVNDMLAFSRIIIAIRVKLGNKFKNVSYIDNVAVQEFKTEINIFQSLTISVWFRIFCHYRRDGWRIDKTHCYVEVFTLVVIELLFCQTKVFRIFAIILIYLDFCVFADNITESKYKIFLVIFILQIVYAAGCRIFLQKLYC